MQVGPAYWKQSNTNDLLIQNNRPVTKDYSMAVAVGNIFQWNRYRMTFLLLLAGNKNSANSESLENQLGGGELNLEYSVIRKQRFSISPIIGGGVVDGIIKIRQQASPQPISSVFVNRNTTELFNRQGFINAGLNFGFAYAPKLKAHLFQLATGYRFGFSNSDWSTDPNSAVLTNSATDPLRQFYVTAKMNFLYADRRR